MQSESGSSRNTIDRVISSYASSLKLLAFAQERNLRGPKSEAQNALLVGMPKTALRRDLPFVLDELEEVASLVSPHIPTKIMREPTRSEVLQGISDHSIIHLACHSVFAGTDPLQSYLLLSDWQISPLTVSDLMELNVHSAQLAYLAASHTATTSVRLFNESISLASAVHLASFRSVVGSLWAIRDRADIARDVYSWMLRGDRLETERSAEALHRALRNLRDKTRRVPGLMREVPDDIMQWAAYVHIGI